MLELEREYIMYIETDWDWTLELKISTHFSSAQDSSK